MSPSCKTSSGKDSQILNIDQMLNSESFNRYDKSSLINQYNKINQTKKTNCPFRLKFIKKSEMSGELEFFEFFEAIH